MADIISFPGQAKPGHGQCQDCVWFMQPEGCNVERDCPVCKLNYRPRIVETSWVKDATNLRLRADFPSERKYVRDDQGGIF